MEEYTNNHLSQNTSPRANLLYSLAGGSSVGNRHHQLIPFNTFHLQTGRSDHCFQPDQAPHPSVKTESNNSHLHYPLMRSIFTTCCILSKEGARALTNLKP
uniref:Uncharacterized protein n=1 Tax=Glycine max TaxID=3847 RepID=C6TFQ4_SOYBN|nr:unknown [Glycine max]